MDGVLHVVKIILIILHLMPLPIVLRDFLLMRFVSFF